MFIAPAPQHSDPWFEARTIQRHLLSLDYSLRHVDWDTEFGKNEFFNKRLKKSKVANVDSIRKLMINAWNTEYLLAVNQEVAKQSGRAFVLHWAFPQAYYSVFGSLLAHFNALGYPQTSHQGVLRHFAQLSVDKKLPAPISVHCDGTQDQTTFHGIQPCSSANHFHVNLANRESVEHQICQFLKSTRQMKLSEKKTDFKFVTKLGKPKQQLSAADWMVVSDKLGPTTILDLLYRKRIKSNYGEVDSYISEDFADGARILLCLREIVKWLNFVNEVYTAKAIGWPAFEQVYSHYKNDVSKGEIGERIVQIKRIVTT